MNLEFLLDPNVLSEFARPRPDPGVSAWLSTQAPIRFAAITLYELSRGVAGRAPPGEASRHAPALDSQALVELVLFLEETFKVDFSHGGFDVALVDSIDEIAAFVDRAQSTPSTP